MISTTISTVSWAEERAVERSAAVQRSRDRIAEQVRSMLDAARRLIEVKGDEFTTHDLVKEAGVALQTFYRYFASKDELLLAVIADAMREACTGWAEAAAEMADPLDRLHFYVTTIVARLQNDEQESATARFIVSTRWRLHRLFPKELAEAEKPFVDLLVSEVKAAADAGLITSPDPEWDSWFIAELIRSVYHHYAYADMPNDNVAEQLWRFCLAALGGRPASRA